MNIEGLFKKCCHKEDVLLINYSKNTTSFFENNKYFVQWLSRKTLSLTLGFQFSCRARSGNAASNGNNHPTGTKDKVSCMRPGWGWKAGEGQTFLNQTKL